MKWFIGSISEPRHYMVQMDIISFSTGSTTGVVSVGKNRGWNCEFKHISNRTLSV